MEVKGILPPLITSFSPDGSLNEMAMRNVIKFVIKGGVHGLFICGTYGSGPLLSMEQKKRVIEICMEEAGEKVTVIAHVGAADAETAIKSAKLAAELGVHAVASVPPYYYAYDEAAVYDYYKRLIEAVDVPVFVYNNPARTGFKITPKFLKKLEEAGAAGIKDSSFDIVLFYEFINELSSTDFQFVIGTEALCLPALQMGAKACIAGLANVFPELVIELYNAIQDRNFERAKNLQLKVIAARRVMHYGPVIPACYEVLKIRGIEAGCVKKPMRPITGEERSKIREGLVALGLL